MPDQTAEAQRFVRDLVSDWNLFTAFVAAEKKASADPEYKPEILDNFLVSKDYQTSIGVVVKTGKAILDDLGVWAGTYSTELSPSDDAGTQSDGPDVTIAEAGPQVTTGGQVIAKYSFSMLTLTWKASDGNPSDAEVVMHRAARQNGSTGAGSPSYVNQFTGTQTTAGTAQNWLGFIGDTPARRPRTPDAFHSTMDVINKAVNAVIQGMQIAEQIEKVAELQQEGQSAEQIAQEQEQVQSGLSDLDAAETDVENATQQLSAEEASESTAESSAESAGESAGEQAAEEAAGEAAGEEAGEAGGEAAGEAAGEAGGEAVVEVLAELCCCCL